MSVKICLFNHKGGVCKTTTAFNLGWMLAKKGKRVLFVDADSQCNLSHIFLTDDHFEEFYEGNPAQNIKEYLAPAFEGRAIPIGAADCVKNSKIDGLFLLPGSFELTEYDVSLGLSFSATQVITAIKHLPGSFNRLIEETAKKYKADYTIIDMNPSLSSINQILLLSSDYFLIPTVPDIFSVMALRSLTRILPRWEEWAKRYARDMFSTSVYPFPERTPKFLGTVIRQFSIKGGIQTHGRVPSKANQRMIDTINTTLKDLFIPALAKAGMTLPADSSDKNYCLAEIQDFHSLNACYHQLGVPVFELKNDQLKKLNETGNVLEGSHGINEIIMEVRENIESMCERIIQLTQDEQMSLRSKRVRRKIA